MSNVNKEKDRQDQQIEKLKTMGPEGIKEANRLKKIYDERNADLDKGNQKLMEDVAGQVSISKAGEVFPTPNLDQIKDARFDITREDFEKPFIDIRNVALGKLEKEKTKAFPVFSKQVNIEAGPIGDPLLTYVFTLDTKRKQKEKKYIEDMLAFDPRELYRYNLYERGISPDQPVSQRARENLKAEHPGLGLAGGGLANLTRTVAPDSGPVSRGLRSLYIDDMD